MPRRSNAPNVLQVRIELAHALGFPDYPLDTTAEPYLNYVTNRHVGRGMLESYIALLVSIVGYFESEPKPQDAVLSKKSIQGLLDTLTVSINEEYFADTKAGSQDRRDDVEDTVLYAIGSWTMMLSSFVHLPTAGGIRKIILAYGLRLQGEKCQPYEENLAGLVTGSGLLPRAGQQTYLGRSLPNEKIAQAAVRLVALLNQPLDQSMGTPISLGGELRPPREKFEHTPTSLSFLDDLDSLESLSVNATRLNTYTLKVFGAVDIAWTHNVSRHLLLSRRNGRQVLEVFALPCALNATSLTLGSVGLGSELAQEIRSHTARCSTHGQEMPATQDCSGCWVPKDSAGAGLALLTYISKKSSPLTGSSVNIVSVGDVKVLKGSNMIQCCYNSLETSLQTGLQICFPTCGHESRFWKITCRRRSLGVFGSCFEIVETHYSFGPSCK